jgi:hypothetical protein
VPNVEVLLCKKNIAICFVFLQKYTIFISTYNYKYKLKSCPLVTPISTTGLLLFKQIFITMRRCSKCDLEKEDNQFYTYYHSTQGKNRTRKICNECIAKQKAEYKQRLRVEKPQPIVIEEPIEFIPPDDYQYCQDCDQWLPKTDFYKRLKCRCIKCELKKDSLGRAEKRAENGGSAKVWTKPNTYVDIHQKEQTFEFMKAVGYTFNEENGIWYKLPWKDKDGNFPLLDTYGRKSKKRGKHTRRSKHDITQEEKDDVIRLFTDGHTTKQITEITGTPNGTVWRWVEKHKSKLEK